MRALFAVALAVLAAVPAAARSAQPAASPARVAAVDAPAAWQPAIARAETAMNGLQSALLKRLKDEMARGGAQGALRVCHEEAKAIAARLAREQGVALGRTSHALRNRDNATPAWAAATVSDGGGRKAAGVTTQAFDLGGGRVGVLRPIGFADMCATCHGPRGSIASDVLETLEALYPGDKATDFAAGDLRGWMWAEVPAASR